MSSGRLTDERAAGQYEVDKIDKKKKLQDHQCVSVAFNYANAENM